MLYPQYFIDDLRSRADLVRILEPYVELKKKGANWMGCCPFHEEKTPSFSVNPSKGFYKCFGCGKGGNVYTFLMEMEGLNFVEAVKVVAEKAGVMLPEPIDDKQYKANKKKRDERKKLADEVIELNKIALEFWEKYLEDDNAHARGAREYLESREISPETQKAFRVGLAPDSWDALLATLKETGAGDKLIEQSGLVSVNEEKNRVFDRFRGRIMFPVLDIDGRPIAFGARALGKDEPKYLNSPETPAYVKGQHLYGLYQSRAEIKRKKFAILVEGYLDLIALYQFGITNTAASLGTAFTPEQAKLLGRFARKVVVNYDGDSAGVKAARRAIEILLAEDLEIKVLVLPEGKDPDDFIRANGSDSYNLLRGKAFPYLQFVLDSAVQERNLGVAKQKAEAIEDVLPVLSVVRNQIQKRETFDQAMNFFRVDDAALKRDLWNIVKQGSHVENGVVKQQVARASQAKVTVAEQRLLELIVFDDELREMILSGLEETDYESLATASIFRALFELREKKEKISLDSLLELVGDDEAAGDYVPVLLMAEPFREPDEAIDSALHEAENCVFTLRSMAITNRITEISQELLYAEQTGNDEVLNNLVAEQIEMAQMKRELQRKIAEN
jgi:DNA primase